MKQKGSVTGLQLGAMTFIFVFSTTLAFLIGPLVKTASFDGWLCILIGGVAGTAAAVLSLRFALRRPDSNLGQYGSQIVGGPVHMCIMLLTAFFHLHLSAYILREFTDFFVPSFLRQTPPLAVAVLVMSAVVALTQSGISALFRFAQGCFIFIGLFFLLKPLFFVSALDSPMWHEFARVHDWRALWAQSFSIIPWYGELTMLAFIVPHFAAKLKTSKVIWISSMLGTYILIVEFFLIVLFFGPKLAGTLIYPALELTGFVHFGDFLYNLDALIVSIWFMGFFVKLCAVFAVGTLIFSEAMSMPYYQPITAPLAAIVVAFSLVMSRNPEDLASFFSSSWPTFALTVECLTLLYPLVAWARGIKASSLS
ncbi:spore germination protein [Paenibacillus oenotherae]|uniref:Spore germination protein n=1 Tax=Paenibacillus oenotherae TaxID=1435645 RepID=A0ABS7D366_9BACL|nr:spore germination protein [Paenibacillus oenotherae]